jgi:hypothetical protein
VPVPGRREIVERSGLNGRTCLGYVQGDHLKGFCIPHQTAPIESGGLELGDLLRREAGRKGPAVESYTRVLMLKLRQASG